VAQIKKRMTSDGEVRYDVRTRIGGRVVTKTFKRKKDAESWSVTVEADKLKGVVVDPRRARISLQDYSSSWLSGRQDLAERTKELYGWLLKRHILPTLGRKAMGAVSPQMVRTWHSKLAVDHACTASKAYRLLNSIMRTAVADEILMRNPCQVRGAAKESSPERPVASVAEVAALEKAMPDHLRLAVVLAAWCQLRRAELLALRRRDVNLLRGTLTVARTRTVCMSGKVVEKAPKSDAGRRTISIPANVVPLLRSHLDAYVGSDPDDLLFDVTDRALTYAWDAARTKVGRPEFHLHDLRHTGLTWYAAAGASMAELQHRGGHSSPVAALRYQHATEDRDRSLAAALAKLADSADITRLEIPGERAMDLREASGE
jgi:integrase